MVKSNMPKKETSVNEAEALEADIEAELGESELKETRIQFLMEDLGLTREQVETIV